MTNSNTSAQPYLFFNGRCKRRWNSTGALRARRWKCQSVYGRPQTRHGAARGGGQSHARQFPYRRNNPDGSGCRCDGQPRFEGFSLSVVVADEQKAEKVFNALADGGKVTMPLEKTFWAAKFGMLEDRFGVGWMVSVQHKPKYRRFFRIGMISVWIGCPVTSMSLSET